MVSNRDLPTRPFLGFGVSSLNGLMAQPGLGAYCSSKFAVRGFTEALRAEMVVGGHKVGVTVVHPGGVKTNIGAGAYEQPDLDTATRSRLEKAQRGLQRQAHEHHGDVRG